MEYLMVVGFSLLIIIPISGLLYGEYQDRKTEMYQEHLFELSREIAYQAKSLYYQGAPSRTTIEAYFPPDIETATVSGNYITFTLTSTPSVVLVESDVRLEGVLATHQGPHHLLLEVIDNNNLNPGDDYVLITEQVR